MNWKILSGIVLVLLALAVPASAATIYGLITDQATGLGISGAQVQVYDNTTSAIIGVANSDATGYYTVTFADVDVDVGYTAAGYATAGCSASATFCDVPFASHPGSSVEWPVQLAPVTPGTLTGVVIDSVSGLPIDGVAVHVLQGGVEKYSATTSATGAYSITLLAGTYTVNFTHASYVSSSYYPVLVNIGATTTRNAVLNPLATLQGTVTNTFGTPISGATVTIIGTTLIASTNGAGFYSIPGITPAFYSISVTAAGHSPATLSNTYLGAGTNTRNFALSSTNGRVAGTLTNPVGTMTITLNSTLYSTTTTTGSYSIEGVTPGYYVVRAATDQTNYYATPAAQSVTVVSGGTASANFNFVLNASAPTPTPTPTPVPYTPPSGGTGGGSGRSVTPTPSPTATPIPSPTPTVLPVEGTNTTLADGTILYTQTQNFLVTITVGNNTYNLTLKRELVVRVAHSKPSGFTSTITLLLANPSNNTLENFELAELLPAALASSPSLHFSTAPTNMDGTKAAWNIASLRGGSQLSLSYSLDEKLAPDYLRYFAGAPSIRSLATGAQGTTVELEQQPIPSPSPAAATGFFTAANAPLIGLAVVLFIIVVATIVVIVREGGIKVHHKPHKAIVEEIEDEAPKKRK